MNEMKEYKKAAKEILNEYVKANELIEERDWYKETEQLLYDYAILKVKVAQDEEALNSGEIQAACKSKDIIRFSGGGGRPPEELVAIQYYRSRRSSMERTRLEVQRIENGLSLIKKDEYYKVIQLKFGIPGEDFNWKAQDAIFKLTKSHTPKTIEDIAVEMNCDPSTVGRNKSRLVRTIMKLIFGSDARTCKKRAKKMP